MTSPKPVRGRIIIDRTNSEWQSQQVQEPCILQNPKDPSRLVMIYSGVPKSNRAICALGKAWATVEDPMTWHQEAANPIFNPGRKGWDSGSIRLDTVLYIPEEDAYYIYYSGTSAQVQDRIGLAICPAGPDGYASITGENIKRWGDVPVLAPDPAAPYREEYASQAAVMREWNEATKAWDWHMYYSYRDKEQTLPGLRYATSTDGKTWTRHWNAADPRGRGHIFDSVPNAYYEWHQISKVGRTYVLSMEVGPEHGKQWRTVLAVSRHPAHGWKQLDADTVLQTNWPGIYSEKPSTMWPRRPFTRSADADFSSRRPARVLATTTTSTVIGNSGASSAGAS
ncbi:MAG: hypothetical protein IPN11_10195 [Opitutaceae bacterium]|nr:hypothetical protein [Opitutaceae bacterium]